MGPEKNEREETELDRPERHRDGGFCTLLSLSFFFVGGGVYRCMHMSLMCACAHQLGNFFI